jgi:hypothetical protein
VRAGRCVRDTEVLLVRLVGFDAFHVKREKPDREPGSDPAGLACVPCGKVLMIESDELSALDPFIAEHLPHADLWLVTEGPENVFTGRRRMKRLI